MLRRLLFAILLILPLVAATVATAPTAAAASPAAAASQATAGIARLSKPLSDYLASLGGRVSVSVIDLGHGTRYAYNPYGRFIMASTVKVALAMAAYERSRRTGVALTSSEQSKLDGDDHRAADTNAASTSTARSVARAASRPTSRGSTSPAGAPMRPIHTRGAGARSRPSPPD